jgi:hypothetical protein
MSTSPQDILRSFDVLPERDQRIVVTEILRRTSRWESAPLSDDDLTLAADVLFKSLDEREEQDAERHQG